MPDFEQLRALLLRLDGDGYRAYKQLGDRYEHPRFTLLVDHVQGDPFADPSRVRVRVGPDAAGIPDELTATDTRQVAVADFLNRAFHSAAAAATSDRGSGRSGEIRILRPGQEVLRRTSLLVSADGAVEARFRVGLPARGRTILGRQAAELLCEDLPRAVSASLVEGGVDLDALVRHVQTVEDARALRSQLREAGLVAFVADGAGLPRRSGVDDRPLERERTVPFRAPDELRVTLDTPHSGALAGMGVPQGVTLLVGGGFHGKSTLLRAIERGVYDHLPGDGRERVVTVDSAVKVRAEDGRSIEGTDISNFIDRLPGGEDTREFRTRNASGSTSQAAAIAEALEVGADCLLIDEDTSATNFLIRDARVQALIARDDEPITPFIDRVPRLREDGVSIVLVVGGAGDYFDAADTVVAMREYRPWTATERAKRITAELPSRRTPEDAGWEQPLRRIPDPDSIDPRRGRRPVDVRSREPGRMRFGEEEIELSAVEQLTEAAQTRAIGRALALARGRCLDGARPTRAALECLIELLERDGLDALDDRIVGDYAEFRIFEVAAALSRLRTLRTQAYSR